MSGDLFDPQFFADLATELQSGNLVIKGKDWSSNTFIRDLAATFLNALAALGQIGPVVVTGVPTVGQVPVATSGAAAAWATPSGGDSSAPQLPAWTLVTGTGGTPGPGQFCALASGEDAAPNAATILVFSTACMQGTDLSNPFEPNLYTFVVLSNGTKAEAFQIAATSGLTFSVGATPGNTDAWDPVNPYVVSFVPYCTLRGVLAADDIAPIADGTYTTGIGPNVNGTVTYVQGIPISVQQAS